MEIEPRPCLAGLFVILDHEEGPALLEEERTVFQHLSASALRPKESIAYLRRLASDQ